MSARNRLSDPRILVIDGEALNRLLLQCLLEQAGYEVDTAIDAPHAAELAMSRSYALVLAGAAEGESDGAVTARRIRSLEIGEAPILALRPGAADGAAEIALPFRATALIARIAARLGGEPCGTGERHGQPIEEPPLIELRRIERLAGSVGGSRLEELLGSYLDGARSRIARMEAHLARSELARLAREAHDLKSLSGTFGAVRLGRLAGDLEGACKVDNAAAAKSAFAAVRAAALATWPLIESRLAELRPTGGDAVTPQSGRARSRGSGRR